MATMGAILVMPESATVGEAAGSGFTSFVANNSKKCMDVTGISTANGALIQQWQCIGGTNQEATVTCDASGWCEIKFRHSGKCLDVTAWSVADGTQLQQWDCHGGDNQRFSVPPYSHAIGEVRSKWSDKCVDVRGYSTANGAAVQQWACHGGSNQQWEKADSNNTGSYGSGDCWRAGTPATCRTNWPGRSQFIRFRAIDQFSGGAPAWMPGAQAAVSAWNSAPGPQLYSFTPAANDTWVYLKDSYTGQNGLIPGVAAVTWNCRQNQSCTTLILLDESIIAHWSEIYFNHDQLDGASNALIQNAFAHESGHAMMLRHNSLDPGSLMKPILDPTIGGPNANDTGAFPGCSSGGFGVNCIYGWGN